MQSANQPSAGKKLGHHRRQSYGKIMPISSLLNNLIGTSTNFDASANDASNVDHSPLAQAIEVHARSNRTNERSDGDTIKNVTDLTMNFIEHEKFDNKSHASPAQSPAVEMDIEKTFLKCVNYHPHESIPQTTNEPAVPDAQADPEDDIDRLLVEEENAPCLICTNKAPIKHNYLNILCKKLCDDSCNTSTKTCQSLDDMITHNNGTSNNSVVSDDDGQATDDRTLTGECADDANANTRKTSESLLQRSNSSRQEFLASMIDHDPADGNVNASNESSHVAPLTIENLKEFNDQYFREKLAIAEALANTSMMTSAAAKSRLAARKIEMSLNTPDFVYDPENAEYIPPKELLMYLVR